MVFLAACSTNDNILVSQRQVVVMPPDNMFQCDAITRFPEPTTLTDLQVARLLVQLYENNISCKNNMNAIRSFLDTARGKLGS
jgi:hypothetical protein